MTLDEIRPALSAEEWGYAREYADEGRGADHFRAEAGPMTWIEPHEVAALALYGQPFGFTWEDVERVNIAGGMASRAGAVTVAENLFILATKLAALLPPQEEGVAR